MIKAGALQVVDVEEDNTYYNGIQGLIKDRQNMVIESVKEDDSIPSSVSKLALRLLKHRDLVKVILDDMRGLYSKRREDFHFSLAKMNNAEKQIVLDLFEDMVGIVSTYHYVPATETLNGKIVMSPKAQKFITGEYLEIAVYEEIKKVITVLSKKYEKTGRVFRNVRVATNEGLLKNEFDIVIEFDGVLYAAEVKSGKNFREFNKYMEIGKEYKIVPDRFLLIDNHLTDAHANSIEYFCEYFVTNLSGDSLKTKVTTMIEKDQRRN